MENNILHKTNHKRPGYLYDYRRKITSQYGEDGIIEKIFEMAGADNKWCVEFGASDGKTLSNTWNLLANRGWSGVMIEAGVWRYKKLCQRYKDNRNVTCVNKLVNFEGDNCLDRILSKIRIPKNFDLLSLDIDGNEYHVWESMKEYWPKVVIIEYNPTIPHDVSFTQPKNMKVTQGSSLLSIVSLAKRKGYELIATTEANAFFIKKEYFPLFNITDNSPTAIHNNKTKHFETKFFQLYDGTIVLSGCTTLLWHGVRIDQRRLQVLPKFLRRHPHYLGLRNLLFPMAWKTIFAYLRDKARRGKRA